MKLHPQTRKKVLLVEGVTVEGQEVYRFADAADLPETRRMFFSDFYRDMQNGLNPEELSNYMDAIVQAASVHDFGKVVQLSQMVKDISLNCRSTDSLYRMASLFYFTLEEDISDYDFTIAEEKIKAFKQVPASDFFLPHLLKHLDMYQSSSLEVIQRSLKVSEAKAITYRELYLRLTGGREPGTAMRKNSSG
ncbi:hypothetical protein V6R21_20270 [Limibacter armeniacum]|uniref:hypothetical protein n=1 Tax=Limibacter armeniacum TaxID=466084 RepID=UPI002FE5F46E